MTAIVKPRTSLGKTRLSAGRPRMSAIAYATIIGALQNEGNTLAQLTEMTGLGEETVRRYLAALYSNQAFHHPEEDVWLGSIYICDWERCRAGRYIIQVYRLRVSHLDRDAPAPRKSGALRQRECRERKHVALMQRAAHNMVVAPSATNQSTNH